MHKSIRKELKLFRDVYEKQLTGRIAELGALDMNGSPRKYLPPLTGFDIVEGNGIDVVIEPGIIPEEYVNKFDVVISSSSFHYCPRPELYKKQILDLLKVGGLLWMSMCGPKCKNNHSTSNNKYKFKDCFRVTKEQLQEFLSPEIEIEKCYYAGDDHHQDIIFVGWKTDKIASEQFVIPAEQFRSFDYKTI